MKFMIKENTVKKLTVFSYINLIASIIFYILSLMVPFFLIIRFDRNILTIELLLKITYILYWYVILITVYCIFLILFLMINIITKKWN